MTQKELADKVHVSQAQIARVENFSYAPSLKTITKIADGLNLELTFIDKTTKKLVENKWWFTDFRSKLKSSITNTILLGLVTLLLILIK